MAQSINERLNVAGISPTAKREIAALMEANLKAQTDLLALLVSETSITQVQADAIAAVGLKK